MAMPTLEKKTLQAGAPILISGTGPAALLFAHSLLSCNPPLPFRIFERDLSLTHRAQGYRFRITGRGVKSCRDVLGPEHFTLLRATCANNTETFQQRDGGSGEILEKGLEALGRLDRGKGKGSKGEGKDGKEENKDGGRGMETKKGEEEEALTAHRTVMRQTLFKGLEKFTEFGKEVVGFDDSAASSGTVVRFADGSTAQGSLLVAADGAFSKIRQQLSPKSRLLDVEMRMVFGRTPLTPVFYSALDPAGNVAELLKGTTLVQDPTPRNSHMFFMYEPIRFGRRDAATITDPEIAAAIPQDYIYWALALRSDEPEAQARKWRELDSEDAADLAEDLTKNWTPSLRAIVTHQDRAHTLPLVSSVTPPPVLDWRTERSPMVTVIGDAAHAMPPTGGVGATTALTDAAVLGAAITEHGVSRRALEVYEREMRGYATQAIMKSLEGGKLIVNMRDVGELKEMGR